MPDVVEEEPWSLFLSIEKFENQDPPFGRARVEHADDVVELFGAVVGRDHGGNGEGVDGFVDVGIRHHVRSLAKECLIAGIGRHCEPTLGGQHRHTTRGGTVVKPPEQVGLLQFFLLGRHSLRLFHQPQPPHMIGRLPCQISSPSTRQAAPQASR